MFSVGVVRVGIGVFSVTILLRLAADAAFGFGFSAFGLTTPFGFILCPFTLSLFPWLFSLIALQN
jgi:hypothetical protein